MMLLHTSVALAVVIAYAAFSNMGPTLEPFLIKRVNKILAVANKINLQLSKFLASYTAAQFIMLIKF